MTFDPFSVTIPHIAYACLGGFVVLFGMFSLFLREKLYIGEACWAFLFGVIIGPYGVGIFNPRGWAGGSVEVTDIITLEFTRVVLAIGVFAIGVELPKAYMARHWKSLFFLLVPVMTWGWFVSAALICALIPKLNFLSSLAVAACLTPTDPILAAAVVGGKYADKHVPAHLRHLLAAESGCNDGAAFPFLYIALYLILDAPNTGQAIEDWFLVLWFYQIFLGCIIGVILGFAFRHLMRFCQNHDLIDRQSCVAQYVSLAMLTIGVTTLLGSDDLLAAFACGSAFAWDGFFNRQTEESVFSSVIDLLFNVGAFVYVGAWMPFRSFHNPETTLSVWRLIVIAILILLLRRLPIIIALFKWIPDIKTFQEALFSGHFGPIGIGAIFISTLALESLNEGADNAQTEILAAVIQPIVAFMVLCSIIIHGLSIPSFSLGRRVHTASRTWSRHAAPDWTNQIRLVHRGDDIVINRDIEMGECPASCEKSEIENQGTPRPVSEIVDENPGSEGSLETRNEEAQVGTFPDRDDVVQEWPEGDQRVVEWQAGPGEDVEVEVRHNNASTDGRSSPLYGHEDVHRVAGYLDKRKPRSSVLPKRENGGDSGVDEETEGIKSSRKVAVAEDDGNVEWDSEHSNGEQERSPSPLRRHRSCESGDGVIDRLKLSKLSKLPKGASKMARGHRHSLSRKKRPSDGEGVANTFDGEHEHGRRRGSSLEMSSSHRFPNMKRPGARISSPLSSHPSSLKNLRLERVRGFTPSSSRDISPSGSVVRFADESRGSGTNTPRSHDSGDERGKVTFAVPETSRT